MRLITSLDSLRQLDLAGAYGEGIGGHSAVAVGVFDGVHLGHQRLLQQLLEMASRLRSTPTVITFANHPEQVLTGAAPPLLCSVPHRLRLLRRAGVLRVVLLTFEPQLRNLDARAFAEQVLRDALRTKGLLLGYDSALGKDRMGTPERFASLGQELGFEVQVGARLQVEGQPASSTLIRQAIAAGDLETAQRFLGRPPGAFGTVIHGDARGRALGFPTANLQPQAAVLPPPGVYAVEAIVDGETWPAVANLGTRPTFAPGQYAANATLLEVHLIGFSGDLYDRELEVTFRQFLRPERRFADAEQLQAQIHSDLAAARAALRA